MSSSVPMSGFKRGGGGRIGHHMTGREEHMFGMPNKLINKVNRLTSLYVAEIKSSQEKSSKKIRNF